MYDQQQLLGGLDAAQPNGNSYKVDLNVQHEHYFDHVTGQQVGDG
jgi:hypothetical protein